MLTRSEYDSIFKKEQTHSYPIVDMYERMHEFAIDRTKLESMARTLACPLKVNPPNWQHGRVLYTTLRFFIERLFKPTPGEIALFLDIGTAKGFSACVMSHAVADAKKVFAQIVSIDVINPNARVPRNSVAEIDGHHSIAEFVNGHLVQNDFVGVDFLGGGSTDWLKRAHKLTARIPFAFIDGKHTYDQVLFEGATLTNLQKPGDILMFDDCQIEPVGRAVKDLVHYDKRYVDIGPRNYCVAVRQ